MPNTKTIGKRKVITKCNNMFKTKNSANSKNNNAVQDLATIKTRSTRSRIVTPIIQTRGMKIKAAKKVNQKKVALQKELAKFDAIDSLTTEEFVAGEDEGADENDVCHDGVVLSVTGSDFEDEDFQDNNAIEYRGGEDDGRVTVTTSGNSDAESVNNLDIESGEIESSDDDSQVSVRSKVVKVGDTSKVMDTNRSSDKVDKFSHLKDDPEFKSFLKEMIAEDRDRKTSTQKRDKKERRERNRSRSPSKDLENSVLRGIGLNNIERVDQT